MNVRRAVLGLLSALLLWSVVAFAEDAVQITRGPKVEYTNGNTAIIAWSTNVNAGTQVKYGTDPNKLTASAGMPWGGITHRVTVKNLQPNTTYYFQAISSEGQGTGTQAASSVSQFQTTADDASPAN